MVPISDSPPIDDSMGASLSDVTIVTVTFNSAKVVSDLVASVPAGVKVVLVDNGSRDIDALLALQNEWVTVLANGSNLGFGAACNRGAAHASTEFIFFVNPDARLEVATLDALLAAAERYPKAAAFNPAILDDRGRHYFKRSSTLLPRRDYMPRGWPSEDTVVKVLSGAAIFIRKSVFERIAGFDENIFLYHEDDDLSLRLREHGDLMFIRAAELMHIGGAGSARSPEVAALKAWHMGRSRVYALRKHGFCCPFYRSLAVACWQLLSPLVWFSKRKRAKQVAFLKGIWDRRGDN